MPTLLRHVQAGIFTLVFLILYPIIRLFPTLFPGIYKKLIVRKIEGTGVTPPDIDMLVKQTTRPIAIWALFGYMRDGILYGQASVGKPAPNPPVVRMDGVTQVNLLDFAKVGRPLVMNFGSCTWPPFVAKLAEITRLHHEYESVADFLTVYIAEAHPTDGWGSEGNAYQIAQHKQMQDRIFAAQMLEEKNPAGPLVVDTLSNEVGLAYRGTPERLCIVMDGIVQYYGEQGPFGYHPMEVAEWLDNYSMKQK